MRAQKLILPGAVLVACVICYLVGYSETYVKTVTVQVPVVQTVHATETVAVQQELPDVCKDLQEEATLVYTTTGGMSKASGDIQLALTELGRAAWEGNVQFINEVQVKINEANAALGTSTVEQGQATAQFQTSLKACEEALNE